MAMWVWVKATPPGIGPLVLVLLVLFMRDPALVPIFHPQPCVGT